MVDVLRNNGRKSNYFINHLKFYLDCFYLIKKEKNFEKKVKYIVLILALLLFLMLFIIGFFYSIQSEGVLF